MTATPARKTGPARTVRLDASSRARLDALAEASDRTLNQLVRYALTAYFDAAPACPTSGFREDQLEDGTRQATLRLPQDLEALVEAHAGSCSVTFSDVVRDAVERWLASADPAALGAPSVVQTGETLTGGAAK